MTALSVMGPAAASSLAAAGAALLALILYSYFGYPLLLRILVPERKKAAPVTREKPEEWPLVTMLVAAYNEVSVIASKIENTLEQDYPRERLEVLVVSDASDDGTDEAVLAIDDPRVRLVRQPVRSGKTAGINRIGREARGSILIQTDANVMFGPGALQALVTALDDPGAGMATGEVVLSNADQPDVAAGEGVYWRYESWTKRVESDRGLLVVASGGIYAIRRDVWQELPETVDGDAVEPLLVSRAGLRAVIVRDAIALEPAAATLLEEFHRKSRIIARQVAGARWIRLGSLPPRILFAYVSHKLLRYAAPFLAVTALVLGLASLAAGSFAGALVAAAAVAPPVLAPLGLLRRPRLLHRLAFIPLYFTVINLAAVRGVLRGVRGHAPSSWSVPASTRPGVSP